MTGLRRRAWWTAAALGVVVAGLALAWALVPRADRGDTSAHPTGGGGGAATSSANSPSATRAPTSSPDQQALASAGQRVAVIGDSLIAQNDDGKAHSADALRAAGWPVSGDDDYYWYGCSGKGFNSPDPCRTTTVQNIREARAQLGAEPDVWVIALGSNDNNDGGVPAWEAQVQPVLAELGPDAVLVWVNQSTQWRTGDAVNEYLATTLASRPNTVHADWYDYTFTHDAHGAVVEWDSATAIINDDSLWRDGSHMTDAGYLLRNAYIAQQTLVAAGLG
ncbi:hypothetical protein [Xylanimonas ulmi]|uniref:Lysophospholipase L1-like esterase n=1 Tax=Xylanimonas ulmi TaxID=228973 RepID=A0A4Q7M3E0_9MICO|nr:hypothetical protein [Xylanibacterium ulmi]RZS61841.1 hypothetical protein EV386_2153 [Xylanibacterium ulmi]